MQIETPVTTYVVLLKRPGVPGAFTARAPKDTFEFMDVKGTFVEATERAEDLLAVTLPPFEWKSRSKRLDGDYCETVVPGTDGTQVVQIMVRVL